MTTKNPRGKQKGPRKKRASYAQRRYTDEHRSAVMQTLKTNAGNVILTAHQTGVPEATVRAWARGWRCPHALQLYEEKGADLAQAAEQIAWQIAGVLPDRLHEAPVNHLATAFGIMVDKMRILRDQPTTIANNTNTNKDERTEHIKAIVNAMTFQEREQYLELMRTAAARLQPGPRAMGSGNPTT